MSAQFQHRGCRNAAAIAVLAAVAVLTFSSVRADDAAGLLRVDAGTNGLVEVEMPFAPLGDQGPGGYVSGLFLGDGGVLSDLLFRRDAATGGTTNAVWSGAAWLDPATGLSSSLSASSGDTLFLLRSDDDPLSFSLFGRAPGVSAHSGAPCVQSLSVDPEGAFADLAVSTQGTATDLFAADFATNLSDAATWVYYGRYPGQPPTFSLRDDSLPPSGGRVYLAADATRDTDGDGLPDEMERLVYGTSPYLADTDGDGFPDGLETLPGLRAEFRLTTADLSGMPDFQSLEPFAVAVAQTVAYSNASWPSAVASRGDRFACRLTGFVLVPAPGLYTFYVTSDDGAELSVDGALVVSDPVPHSSRERSGSVALEAGWRPVELLYYENRSLAVLSLSWSGPGLAKAVVPASALRHVPANLAPVVSLSVSSGPHVEGLPVGLSASARDVEGEVVSLSLYDGEALLSAAPGGAASATATPAAGTHVFRAVAEDDLGDTSESSVEVVVEPCPAAYALGLNVAYYAFASQLRDVPDVSGRMPTATGVVGRIYFPSTTSPWAGAPAGLADRYAAVFEGALLVREAGWHTLSLRSDDGARLFIDGVLAVDNGGSHAMSTASASVPLSAGLHDLRVEYYENAAGAGLEFSWKRPGASSEVVPPCCLFRRVGEPDSDGDGMPDWWEEMYALDPADASDASLDPDGDGLDNLAEFRAGSDPRRADTDGDGMPDAWEAANGTYPCANDILGDPDGDGLVNIEEFRYGTDPRNADTDGDGCSDGVERHVYFSDPTAVDFTGEITTNSILVVLSADDVFGDWAINEDRLLLVGRAGTLFFTNDLVLAEAGLRQIRIRCMFSGQYNAQLVCRADGQLVGELRLPASTSPCLIEGVFLTQWLNAGVHELSFEVQNFANGAVFEFLGGAVCEPLGPDSDGNGRFDWLDARIRNSSSWRTGLVVSKISPFCIRGENSSWVLPVVATPSSALIVMPLPNHGWCANVPLDAGHDIPVSVRYENGMKTENNAIRWVEFNIMVESDTVVRKGDSLLLSLGGAQGTIKVDGATISSSGSATAYQFNAPGEHFVQGICDGVERGVPVMVVDCSMPNDIPVWRGKTNSIRLTGSGYDVMSVSCEQSSTLAAVSVSGVNCVCSLFVPMSARPNAFSCEIMNPDASVVACSRLLPFSACYTLDGFYYISHCLGDGTRVVENRFSAFDLPPTVEFRMNSASGVCFEDGSGRLVLHADDFDEVGDYIYRFLLPVGVSNPCQFLYAYFDGKEISQ